MKCIHDIADCQLCEQRFTSVLCKVHDEYLEEINRTKVHGFYKRGQVIFSEGAYPFGIYCINSGKIKLSRMGDDGKEQITRLVKDGDVIGYRAMLNGERYTATATALADTKLCFIPKDVFVKLLKSDPILAFEILRILSKDLFKTEVKMTHLAQKPVRERLAETLLHIKDIYGFEADGVTLNVRLTREEIANMVGTATESAIRFLSEFKRDNIIALAGKRIKILNLHSLIQTANIQE